MSFDLGSYIIGIVAGGFLGGLVGMMFGFRIGIGRP